MTSSESPTHPDAPRADEARDDECGLLHPNGVFCDRPMGHVGSHAAYSDSPELCLSWGARSVDAPRARGETPTCPTCEQPMRRLPFTGHWYCKPCDTHDRLAGRVPTALDIAAAPPSPERASPPSNTDDSRGHKSTSPCEKCGAMEVYVAQDSADDADFTIRCYACGMHYRVDGPDA